METLPSTRAEALRLGFKHYFTGKTCKHGHVSRRAAHNSVCHVCLRISTDRWVARNPGASTRYSKAWQRRNPDWRAEWLLKNRERVRQWSRTAAKRHPAKFAAKTAKRRATKLRATPPWLTVEHHARIRWFYSWAHILGGVHVDHIWPLRGVDACGLHVPWNLRLALAEENIVKGNKRPDALVS